MSNKKRIVVLISGSGSNLQSLTNACANGQIDADIVAVFSNRSDAYGLERAKRQGINTQILEHTNFESRQAFDTALATHIDSHQPDLIVLAGFMHILSAKFVKHYQGRLLNIHPSLLPDYKGLNTHRRALDDDAETHGASVHFVSAELDGGPVILQARVPVETDDNVDSLAARVLTQEHIIYPQVVEWFCAGRLMLTDNTVYLDGTKLLKPLIHTVQG